MDTAAETIRVGLTTHGVRILIIGAGAFLAIRILHTVVRRALKSVVEKTYKLGDHVAQEKRQATLEGIAFAGIKPVVWIIAGLMIISELGVDIRPLLATAGIAGIALGFGAQHMFKDFIAGLFIILEDQYRKGDMVKVGGVSGLVQDITLHRTVLRDLDGVEHTIPNGKISVTSNMTKVWSRAHLNIGVSYSTDLDKAMNVLNQVGKDMAEDEQWKNDFTKPIEVVGVDDFADSAIIIKVLGDTKPMRQWDIMREYRKRVKVAFDRTGIEIPFPHRTVYMHQESKRKKEK